MPIINSFLSASLANIFAYPGLPLGAARRSPIGIPFRPLGHDNNSTIIYIFFSTLIYFSQRSVDNFTNFWSPIFGHTICLNGSQQLHQFFRHTIFLNGSCSFTAINHAITAIRHQSSIFAICNLSSPFALRNFNFQSLPSAI
mmetsp:Transcript_9901/g.22244  ORF Transcript_9901/g.22244 Transcript_9901/m.22244 type:complete len:142 (-) Transcript_9901:77-502(-)